MPGSTLTQAASRVSTSLRASLCASSGAAQALKTTILSVMQKIIEALRFRCYYVVQVLFDHEIFGHSNRIWAGADDGCGLCVLCHARSARHRGVDGEAAGDPGARRAQRDADAGESGPAGVHRAAGEEPRRAGVGDSGAAEAGQTQRESLHEAA